MGKAYCHQKAIIVLSLYMIFLFSCSTTSRVHPVPATLPQPSIGMLKAVTCKNISRGREVRPIDETEVFTIQDKQAVMWIKLKGLRGKHTLRWKWYDPQGNLYTDSKDFPIGSEDLEYQAAILWHKIGIFGEKAANMTGEWQVVISLENNHLITKDFKIVDHLDSVKKQDLFSGSSPYQDSWALIASIDDYQYIPKLNYAVADGRAIKNILVQDMDFPEDHITYLTNQEATRGNILRCLGDDLPKKTGEKDRVLVFFSGHGYTRKMPLGGEMGYLMPVEAKAGSVHSTAISMAQIRDISQLIPAKHMLFIIDACYSGLVGFQTRDVGVIEDFPAYLAKLTTSRGRQILTAGKADEEVIESDLWGHSVYTKFLIRGLKQREADLNLDSLITTMELQTYLQPRVSKETGYRQTPQMRCLDGEGEFVFLLK